MALPLRQQQVLGPLSVFWLILIISSSVSQFLAMKDSMDNQRAFLNEVGKKFGHKEGDLSAWYLRRAKDVTEMGGLMMRYKNSLYRMLSTVYPEYDWLPWKFQHAPLKSLEDVTVMRRMLKEMEAELKINNRLG